jgi:hypothetical protein
MLTRLSQVTILIAVCLTGCAPKDDVKKAEAEVDVFHERWNKWDFTGVYNDAHAGFRSAQDPQKSIAQMQYARKMYGAWKSATQSSMNVSEKDSQKDVTLQYNSVYEHGATSEGFTFRMTGGKPLLLNYTNLAQRKAAK